MSGPEGFGRPSDDPARPDFARPDFARPDALRPDPWADGPGNDPVGPHSSRPTASRPTASWPTASWATPTDPDPHHPPGRWVPVTRAPAPLPAATGPGRGPDGRLARRRRAPVVVLVLVLVLAGLLVGADRLGNRVAEQRIAAALQARLQTAEKPTVVIVHAPFLTQLAAQDVTEVRVRTGRVPGTDTQLALDSLDLTLRDVRPRPDGTLRVGRLTGTAHLDYAALGAKLGQTVRYAGRDSAGRGRIGFDLRTTILGQTIRATVTGRLGFAAREQAVTMSDTQITVSGLAIPTGLAQRLVDGILRPVQLDALPLGIRLDSLDVDPGGLVAGLDGTDLTLPGR